MNVVGVPALGSWVRRRSQAASLVVVVGLFVLVSTQLETNFGSSDVKAVFSNYFYDAVGEAAGLTCLLRALRGRPDRSVWALIGLGILLWTGGDLYYTFAFHNASNPPFPSLADAGYLAFYPPVFVGLGLHVRRRVLEFSRSVWLDGVIVALTGFALAASVVLGEVWQTSTGGTAAVATNLAYPVGDGLLLALLLAALAFSGWSVDGTWSLLAGGLAVFAVSDSTYLVRIAEGTYHYGTWLDLGWIAAFVLIAGATCLPQTGSRTAQLDGWGLVIVPGAAALACLTIVIYDHFHRVNSVALLAACLAILAVVARLTLTFAEHIQLLRQTTAESLTDALTGLGNRRALLRRLDALCRQERPQEHILILLDLDGFKDFNDRFGHSAGDLVLGRLGQRLQQRMSECAVAYRLGGDEFCLLVEGKEHLEWCCAAAAASLREQGDNIDITCSSGHVLIPDEATTTEQALQLADHRMYVEKRRRRTPAGVGTALG